MNPKLLIIDDEQGVLNSYSRLLENEFEVHTADTVLEGIKKLSSNTYKVAIIDIRFPEAPEGGLNIVHYIEKSELKTVPIILTGKGTVDHVKKVFGSVYDFIEKGSHDEIPLIEVLIKALDAVKKKQPHSYFLSYSWDDSDVADHVEVLVRRNNRNILRDEEHVEAGGNISSNIQYMIDNSDTFISLWSENYAKSSWCPNELEYARNRQHNNQKPNRVIIITLDQTDVPLRFTTSLRVSGYDRKYRAFEIRKIIDEENN